MCKDNITSAKGLAYHAAGCPLRSFNSLTLTGRFLQGYRGRKSGAVELHGLEDTAFSIDTYASFKMILFYLIVTILPVAIILGSAVHLKEEFAPFLNKYTSTNSLGDLSPSDSSVSLNNNSSTISSFAVLRLLVILLSLIGWQWFYGFALGLGLRMQRVPLFSPLTLLVILFFASLLPTTLFIHMTWFSSPTSSNITNATAAPSSVSSLFTLICESFAAGLLISCATTDILLEEFSRKEFLYLKGFTFTATLATLCALSFLLV